MTILTILGMILVVTTMVGINALYVAGEFSTVSARRTRIMQMADEGNPLARMLTPIIQDTHRLDNFIAASQVGITLSSIVLGIYGQNQIAPRLVPLLQRLPLESVAETGGEIAAAGIAAIAVLFFLTTLQVVFGELVPKSVALQYPETVALATAVPMRWSADFLLKPLIILLNGSGRLILRLLGISPEGGHTHVHSPEEIIILVSESHRGGLLDADERRLLSTVFRIRDTHAGEIAVPRTRIIAAEIDRPVEEVLRKAAESSYTRIPVFEEDIDHIIGFVHLNDLFRLYQTDPQAGLRSIRRDLPFVPETLSSIEVWNRLNEAQSYLAVVIDEYGGTFGLITREDLLEEFFGEMQDEFDRETALILRRSPREIVVRGDMRIGALNDLLDLDLPHDTTHTVGGMVLEHLGRIPQTGDEVVIKNVKFQVEAVQDMAAHIIRVALPGSLPPAEEASS